jgi:glycogen(starch) synthase
MYPPHHFGGYELVWRSAMRHVERRGHEVRVLTTDLDTGAMERDDNGVCRELRWYWRDHGYPRLPGRERLQLELHNARTLKRHLMEFSPDVVTWWSMGGMSLSMLERVRRAGIPAVAFVHDDWLDYGPHVDGWVRAFDNTLRLLAPVVDRVTGMPTRVDFGAAARYVFVSETTRQRALATGMELASTGIAHSGIDPDFIDPASPREWSWSLLYVGRLDERKGVVTTVTALAHLPQEATLTLVGGWDAREEERLRAVADRLGVADQVRFSGQRTRAEVRAAYADADAVVFPVIWDEPWGLVPIEAMARGRPVVATGRGGSGEYLRDGENAVLFPAGDEQALAACVRRLADDPQLRTRLAVTGLETARLHTQDAFNDAVLRELTAARQG